MNEFQDIVIEIDEAIRISARWGSDAHWHLLDLLREIVEKYEKQHDLR